MQPLRRRWAACNGSLQCAYSGSPGPTPLGSHAEALRVLLDEHAGQVLGLFEAAGTHGLGNLLRNVLSQAQRGGREDGEEDSSHTEEAYPTAVLPSH